MLFTKELLMTPIGGLASYRYFIPISKLRFFVKIKLIDVWFVTLKSEKSLNSG